MNNILSDSTTYKNDYKKESFEAITGYLPHDACELFPLMPDKDLESLAKDIGKNGLIEPIVLHKRLILDGRNRLLACHKAGATPRFIDWDGEGSPTEWIISKNIHRRHLKNTERALLAARFKKLLEQELLKPLSTKRQEDKNEADQCLAPANWQKDGNKERKSPITAKLSEKKDLAVRAARILTDGAPELVQAVEDGKLSIGAAAELTSFPIQDHSELKGHSAEYCIVAIRGKPELHIPDDMKLLDEPQPRNQRKPEAVYLLVEKICLGSKLEMFARNTREGWQVWDLDSVCGYSEEGGE